MATTDSDVSLHSLCQQITENNERKNRLRLTYDGNGNNAKLSCDVYKA